MLKQTSQPALVVREDLCSALDLLQERAAAAPDHIAFLVTQTDGSTVELTLPQFLQRVDRVATRLLREGIRPGECVAILGATSFGWAVAEWAIYRVGGVVVPLYETAPPDVLRTVLEQTGTRAVFVDASRAEALGSATSVPLLLMQGGDRLAREIGVDASAEELAELDARRRTRDDAATIVFTSGTSGEPQGTVIAHRNLIDLVLNVQAAWSDVLDENGATVIFLPLAHVLARGLQMICLWAGMRLSHLDDPAAVVRSLPQLQPTFLVVVPRVLEKIRDAARANAARARIGWLWADAEMVAIARGRAAEQADRTGDPLAVPVLEGLRHALYRRLFYRSLTARLGGRLGFMLSGAAPLDPELSLLFRGMGIPVMEGYGLTETTAPLAGNRPGNIRSGSVGQPVPGTAVRRDDEGILWVKGVGVAPGYLDDEQTANAFSDGWLNTGDLGEIDDDGFLWLTGRAKDIIVTSGGKSISPARWCQAVESNPLVAHALVVGDQKPYPAAILLLDPQALPAGLVEAPEGQQAQRVTDAGILRQLDACVEAANGLVSRSESVKRYAAVIVDLSPEAGWLTATLKLRRTVVEERLPDVIGSLYGDRG